MQQFSLCQKDVYSNCGISYMYYSETMGLFKTINQWNKSNKVFWRYVDIAIDIAKEWGQYVVTLPSWQNI